ncbi:winged helix-turn-helix transcriptional regulator [Pseudanabaena biceps]|nr:winged helix-turn-helix transcriptional regulator [Pseudanabaena biceps]
MEYSLLAHGVTLKPIMELMYEWGKQMLKNINLTLVDEAIAITVSRDF